MLVLQQWSKEGVAFVAVTLKWRINFSTVLASSSNKVNKKKIKMQTKLEYYITLTITSPLWEAERRTPIEKSCAGFQANPAVMIDSIDSLASLCKYWMELTEQQLDQHWAP